MVWPWPLLFLVCLNSWVEQLLKSRFPVAQINLFSRIVGSFLVVQFLAIRISSTSAAINTPLSQNPQCLGSRQHLQLLLSICLGMTVTVGCAMNEILECEDAIDRI